ncbi:MAG: ATP-binding protein [Cucumibacter sp.]
MADQPVTDRIDLSAAPRRDGRRERLYDGRWVLIASAIVMASLAGLDRLTLVEAAASFALVLLAAIAIPRRPRAVQLLAAAATGADDAPDESTRRFADALSAPCFLIDGRAHLRYANPAAMRAFPGAALGDPLAFTLRNPAFLNTVDQAVRTGSRAEGEFSISLPTEAWFRVEVTPLQTGSASPRAQLMNVMLSNQSEQRRLDRMRADFVANASHELRTPLTSVIGFIDTLMGPAADDETAREKFLGIMRAQAERMARLIEDLLSLSRIELHQHLRPTGTANLALVVGEVLELLAPQARDAGLALEFESLVENPVVTGDRHELNQVFENLVNNAIKYGGGGGRVRVVIDRATGRVGADIVVRVIDYGAGIASENVPRLTERFYRVDAESSRRNKGTGLGLAIVKHIVTRHRGELTISSELGKGTVVSVYLAL